MLPQEPPAGKDAAPEGFLSPPTLPTEVKPAGMGSQPAGLGKSSPTSPKPWESGVPVGLWGR